jgi:hypothetical protein
MKAVFIFLFFSFIIYKVSAQEITFEKLKTDKNLISYKAIVSDVQQKIVTKYFVIPRNFESLKTKNGHVLSIDSLKDVLKNNGMSNSDEFINLVNKQQIYLMKFFQNHPEIQKLDLIKKNELFMKLLSN